MAAGLGVKLWLYIGALTLMALGFWDLGLQLLAYGLEGVSVKIYGVCALGVGLSVLQAASGF